MSEKKGVQDLAAEVAELRAHVKRLEKRIEDLANMSERRIRDLIDAMRAVRPSPPNYVPYPVPVGTRPPYPVRPWEVWCGTSTSVNKKPSPYTEQPFG